MDKPQRMGIVANLYPQYTASHMTEALMNVWDPGDKRKGFKSIDSYTVEWDIKVNRIHKVRITSQSGTGVNSLVYEEILLGFPMKVLCQEDCKGICKVCGANLNQGECGCVRTEPDPRMSVIRDIFNNVKEV